MVFHAIIFLLLFGAGVWVFLQSRKKAARIKAAGAWPSVPGKVTASEIQSHESTDSDGMRSTSYTLAVSYSYEFQGQARTGSRIYVGDNKVYSTLGGARKALAAYPVGAAVNVHIDPADSTNTALTVGGGTSISGAIILWVIAVISLFLNGHQ